MGRVRRLVARPIEQVLLVLVVAIVVSVLLLVVFGPV
jgi:hypothetical protein